MKSMKFIWQLFPTYILITVISLFAVTYYASVSMKSFFLEETANDIKARAILFEKTIKPYLIEQNYTDIDASCDESGKSSNTRITVILNDGKVIGDSDRSPEQMDNHKNRPEIMKAVDEGYGLSIRFSNTVKKNLMYVAVPVHINNELACIIRVSVPVSGIDDKIFNIQIKVAIGGLVIALFAAWISWFISRKISKPIEELTKTATKFSEGNFDIPLLVPDTEEMIHLARSMKHMASQLDERIKTIDSQRNTLDTVLSGMKEGVMAIDTEQKFLLANKAAADMFGLNVSSLTGNHIYEVIRLAGFLNFVEESLKKIEYTSTDITTHKAFERILNLHSSPLKSSDDTFIGILIVINDVTKIRRLEVMRRDFVTNISHEIKTPLTPILGAVETIKDMMPGSDADRDRFFDIIDKNIKRLSTTIEDLITLSGIETKSSDVLTERESSDILSIIEDIVISVEPRTKEKDLKVLININENLKADLHIGLFKRAVANLLDNAIKNSDKNSEIIISAKCVGNEIEISFKDQGHGISEKHQSRIFERFYRVDDARNRQTGGSGLGLAIVKHIVNAHGGDISVKSILGKGTEFIIRISKTM